MMSSKRRRGGERGEQVDVARIHYWLGRRHLRLDSTLGGTRQAAGNREIAGRRHAWPVALDPAALDFPRVDQLHDREKPWQAWHLRFHAAASGQLQPGFRLRRAAEGGQLLEDLESRGATGDFY